MRVSNQTVGRRPGEGGAGMSSRAMLITAQCCQQMCKQC